jgi:hypothetical protein
MGWLAKAGRIPSVLLIKVEADSASALALDPAHWDHAILALFRAS